MTGFSTVEPRLMGSINIAASTDAKRAGLLAMTRRMTLLLVASLPALAFLTMILWPFRTGRWTPVLLVVAGIATLLAGAVTAELWRRLATLSDLTTLNQELHYRATHDLLMGIPNRDLLHAELARSLETHRATPGRVGLCFLDLDRFKFVNDTLGHASGDMLLQEVGRRIKRAVRDEDAIVARVGGDELVVLLRSLDSTDHLGSVADSLLDEFVAPFTIDGVELHVGTSIGMAASVAGETADELYRHADAALYAAKEGGRRQKVLADDTMRAKRDSRVRTELALRSALAHDQIEAWFQPEVDLVTGRIVAAEALARWRTDDGIEVASSFIDVARRAGMLEQLMATMSAQLWAWRRETRSVVPVALNVSASHLQALLALHDDDQIARPFVGMRLEIAETDIIYDFERTRQLLDRVRRLGAQVMLDDFGAGFSSLQMLSDLPIDGIKIDRSYVARIETDWRVRNLVTSLAEFARSCNMIVVAEGVETPKQAEFLIQIGIDRAQGFLFSAAVDTHRFNELLVTGYIGTELAGRF